MRHERGATLVIALIFLIVLTLFALSSYNSAMTDLKSVGNSQARTEALNSAQEAIELALSSPQFTIDPANALPNPCGAANTFCTDYDANGTAEYVTKLEPLPACMSMKVIKVPELNLSDAEDLSCAVGQSQQFGIAGADLAASDSICANTTWQIIAQASSPSSGAKLSVTQGVGIRIGSDDMAGACL